MPSELLTATEVAARLSVHPKTVLRWAKSGTIEHVTLPSGSYRFPADTIDAILESTQAAS